MPDDPTPPRRRLSDKERRRWTDQSLDLLADSVEEMRLMVYPLAREVTSHREAFDEWKVERRDDVDQLRKSDDRQMSATDRLERRLDELQTALITAQKRHAYGKDPENGQVMPWRHRGLTWGSVARAATIAAAFFGPAALIIAALITGGS